MRKHVFKSLLKAGEFKAKFDGAKVTFSASRPLTADVMLTLEPTNEGEAISNAQIRTARMWADDKSRSGKGDSDDRQQCYDAFKYQYLAPILAESDNFILECLEKAEGLKTLMGNDHALTLVANNVSIKDLNRKQVANALAAWQMELTSQGIELRMPEDFHLALQAEAYQGGS